MTKQSYKKFVATAATATLVASALAPVAASAATENAFTDVGGDYIPATNYLAEKGISGFGNGIFKPSEDITRADAAVLIAKVLGLPTDAPSAGFTDVKRADAVVAVNALKAAGITNGKTATTFGATDQVTRGEVAIWLQRAFKLETGADAGFTDAHGQYKNAVNALKNAGVTNGKTATTFGVVDNITRGELAIFVYKLGKEEVVTEVKVESVKAINATTAAVTFKNSVPADVDFSNFDIDGGLTVTDVKLSADRKTATITVNPEFVRNQEYTVSVFGVMGPDGEFAESKGKFSWEVAEGVVVALESTTLEQGQTVGLTVKDAGGKDVKDAEVTVTSLNTNLATVTQTPDNSPKNVKLIANNDKLAGTTDVLVKTELPDGSVLNNTFKVTVKEAVTTVANAGYTLANVTPVGSTATPYANTLSFKDYGKSVTSLVEGTAAKQLVAFAETNGNPDVTHLDFTDAKVTSSNAIVATAAVTNTNEIEVTPLKAGTATIQVTMKDGSRKSFPITVTAEPVITDLYVSETTVNLSDQNRTEATIADGKTGQDGVDAKKIEVKTLDQYKNALQPANGKVTVTSSTDGVKLFNDAAGTTEYVTGANSLTLSSGADSFYIQAQKDKPVSNAKVTVSYFKNTTDTKPTTTKTITVNVAKIDPAALTSDIDVVAGTEIDANALNLTSGTNAIDFATEVYALDSKGNRLENLSTGATNPGTTTATLDVNNTEADKFVDATGAVVSFDDVNSALSYLRASSTVDVKVSVTEVAGPSNTQVVTKVVPVTYKNSAVVPNKVTVATSPIAIKMPAGTISYDEIIFGKIDGDQLIKDNAELFDLDKTHTNHFVKPLKTAKNAGYAYNKSIVSVLGTDGKALNTGAALYGNLATQADGNIWMTKAIEDMVNTNTKLKANSEEFEYEFAIANVSGDVTPGPTDVTLTAGQSSTFTLVLSGVYVKDSVLNVEGTALASATSAEKAKHNLLAAPVQLNVSVSAE